MENSTVMASPEAGPRWDGGSAAGGCAIVLGARGRVGGAFARRLLADGFLVADDPAHPGELARTLTRPLLFDCAYSHGDAEAHVARVASHLADWRHYAAIFLPSSEWIDGDGDYPRAKRALEALALFYRGVGACVVVDRIGYFPGDGVEADPGEPMIGRLVDGDALYARVMARMLAEPVG